MNDIEGLRAAILNRYRSVHAFCRAHPELKRSTVYLVLSGRYPGNAERQLARIRAALTGAAKIPVINAAEVVEVLQGVRCTHCRRTDRRGCRGCRVQTGREAEALALFLAVKGGCYGTADC